MSNSEGRAAVDVPVIKRYPLAGLFSILIGGASLFPLFVFAAPIGIFLGLVALVKRQFIAAIIGIGLSVTAVVMHPVYQHLVECALEPENCIEEVPADTPEVDDEQAIPAPENETTIIPPASVEGTGTAPLAPATGTIAPSTDITESPATPQSE